MKNRKGDRGFPAADLLKKLTAGTTGLMTCSLTKSERLKRGDFRGKRWIKCSETAHFVLFALNNRCGTKRMAVTIRKKTGDAVVRNRVRRIVKEFFRLHKDLFKEDSDSLVRVKGLPDRLDMVTIGPELHVLAASSRIRTSIR